MVTKSRKASSAPPTAPAWSSLTDVLGTAADWAWEQDLEYRFVRFAGDVLEGGPAVASDELLGRTRWDLGLQPVSEASWNSHREQLSARLPFRNAIFRLELPNGNVHFIRVSGAPSFDEQGRWTGYRGVGEDITAAQVDAQCAQWFKAIIDNSPDSIFLSDPATHRFLYVNNTACRAIGFTREEMMKTPGYTFTGRSREETSRGFADTIAAGENGLADDIYLVSNKDGKRKGWMESHRRAVWLDGRWLIVTVSREVTRRVLTEQALVHAKRMYAALSATNETIARARTPDELYQGVCDAAVEAGHLASASILLVGKGGNLRPVAIAGAGRTHIQQADISVISSRPEGRGLNGVAFRSGEPCVSNDFLNDPRTRPWHQVARENHMKAGASIPLMRDGKAMGVLFLCAARRRTFNDETMKLARNIADNLVFGLQTLEHEQDRERAEELATHDSLTGLPNRVLFGELLHQAMATARRNREKLAVMFIDLDRFKLVNDTLGHTAGDTLLKNVTSRLRATLRECDVLARVGGDEFVILLQNIGEPDYAAVVARKLLDTALTPMIIMGQECHTTASIGIALYPDHGNTLTELMKNADRAMYMAKEKGKNTFECYLPEMRSKASERLTLEPVLLKTVSYNEFFPSWT